MDVGWGKAEGVSVGVAVTASDAVPTARLAVPRRPVGVVLIPAGFGQDAVRSALLRAGFAVLGAGLVRRTCRGRTVGVPDVPTLADRLVAVTRWAQRCRYTAGLAIGYYGTSVGAAIALRAAAELNGEVAAVVSSAGRPDLVRSHVTSVTAATLLIVGGADPVALDRNGGVEPLLRCPSALEIISGATHRFGEPGAMDQVVDLTVGWFDRYLARRSPLSGTDAGTAAGTAVGTGG